MSNSSQVENKKTKSILSAIERFGNKFPHPCILFLYLGLITLLLSFVLSLFNVSAIHPGTGETVKVINLLSKEGFIKIVTTAQTNFTEVSALGMVLMCMMGVSLCEQTGLFNTALRASVQGSSGSNLKVIIIFIFIAVLADVAAGVGWVVLPPLGAIIWYTMGRNPIAGMFCGYATTACAYCANFLITAQDMMNVGYTQAAIDLIDPSFVLSPASNWYLSSACAVLLVPICLFVTLKFVEPRLGKYDPSYAQPGIIHPDEPVSAENIKAAKTAGLAGLVYAILIAVLTITGVLSDPVTGSAAASAAPLMKGMSLFIALLFAIPGLVYGFKTGFFKNANDVGNALSKAMSNMGSFVAFIFFLGQFIKYFGWSNLGIILSIKGTEAITNSGLPIIVVLVLTITLIAVINVLMGGAGTKWAIMAPVVIPMFMMLGYNPAVTQMAFRVGDAVTNPISLSFAYFGMLLTEIQKYDSRARTGTLWSGMIPYCIVSYIAMTGLFVIWFIFKIPFGIGGQIFL